MDMEDKEIAKGVNLNGESPITNLIPTKAIAMNLVWDSWKSKAKPWPRSDSPSMKHAKAGSEVPPSSSRTFSHHDTSSLATGELKN